MEVSGRHRGLGWEGGFLMSVVSLSCYFVEMDQCGWYLESRGSPFVPILL